MFVAVAAVGACGDDGSGADSGDDAAAISTTTNASIDPAPLTVGELGSPTAGSALVAIGSDGPFTLEVTSCAIDLSAEPEAEVPSTLVAIQASGATADGTPLLLDVKRFRSAGAATTITDTVTLLEGTEEAPVRALVAQRFEVGGQVTDGRDPDADDPLLRIAGGVVSADGVFAPPGAFAGEPGAVIGAIAAACP